MTTMNTANRQHQQKLTFKITDAEKQLGRAKSIFLPKQEQSQVINKVYHNPTTTLLQNGEEFNQNIQRQKQLHENNDQNSLNNSSPIIKSHFNSGQSELAFSNQISPSQSVQNFNSQPNINEQNQEYMNKVKLLQSNTNRTQVQLDPQFQTNNVIEIIDGDDHYSLFKHKLQDNNSIIGPNKSQISKSLLANGEFESTVVQNHEKSQERSNRHQFYIEPGNYSEILQALLNKRGNWEQNLDSKAQGIRLKWFQSLRGIQFDQLNANDKSYSLQLINRFKFQKVLGDKIQLYANLEQYCKETSIQLHQIMPLQFSLNLSSPEFGTVMHDILKQFKLQQWKLPSEKIVEKTFQTKLINGKQSKVQQLPSDTQWMLKISNLDSMKGVQLIEDFEQFTDVMQYKIGKEEQVQELRVKSNGDVEKRDYSCFLRSDEFVLQQYLTNPLLIDGKKVQIGALILITNENAYFCKESLVRVADRNYVTPDDGLIGNTTNPYPIAYLREKVQDKLDLNLTIQKIKEKSKIVYQAVREKINATKIRFCMEIFEFEFFINAFGECYIIEVNMNLKWTATSNYWRKFYPCIFNEALKLTLDPLFPPAVVVSSEYENIWSLIN